MSDFMSWLYANYIKPQLDATPKGLYYYPLDSILNNMCPSDRAEFEKVQEFTAINAFLLGVRTGEGLALSRR